MFRLVRQTDARLLFANGLLLRMVTLVPFPTAVVAEYLQTSAATTAVEFYCGSFLVNSVAFYLLAMAAFRKEMLDPNASAGTAVRLRRSYRSAVSVGLCRRPVRPLACDDYLLGFVGLLGGNDWGRCPSESG